MKVNEHHAPTTSKVLLVPYSKHHVPTYHTWMQDPELQAATASEPLTIEEEYAMQKSWREDADKLTFIICFPLEGTVDARQPIKVGIDDAPERMVGDINLFFVQPEDDDNDENGSEGVVGEIELMIARKDLHRQGYGRAALITFMGYILFHWPAIYLEYSSSQPKVPGTAPPVQHDEEAERMAKFPACSASQPRPELRYLRVKIQQSNQASIKLFESVGFTQTSAGANYFGEIELRWHDDGGFLRRLKDLPWMKGDGWDAGVAPYDESTLAPCAEKPRTRLMGVFL
ncbi:hypothetical protein LTR17_005309 [Elasticomyces elasticus]|nr:hypothetical protein LTR17_005309 [Elasticomyces elasticus]